MELDPFSHLPYDKMTEICESLDNQSLGKLVRTSKKAYETCQGVLADRKEALRQKLISDLLGDWYIQEYQGLFIGRVTTGNEIFIKHRSHIPPLLKNMKERFNMLSKRISMDDIPEMQYLLSELHRRGFKKIDKTKDIFAVQRPTQLIVKNYKGAIILDYSNRTDLIELLGKLNVIVLGNETDQELKEKVIQELDKRGKIVPHGRTS